MLKRSLVFTSPVMLSLKNSQLVATYKDMPDVIKTVPIEDIGTVLIESQMTSITMPLINALADSNVCCIICNRKDMPNVMLQPFDSNNTQCETLHNQIAIGNVLKKQLWKQIIEAKIRNQSLLLCKLGKNGDLLKPHYCNVKSGDSDNREGQAAKLYWSELFGNNFVRDRDSDGVNSLLNYGYSILRAATARAIVSSGLYPGLGLFHHNRSNAFPLADDLMEPYRPYVDEIVYSLFQEGNSSLTKSTKIDLIHILYCDAEFGTVTRPLSVGLSFTTASLVRCLNKDASVIDFPVMK